MAQETLAYLLAPDGPAPAEVAPRQERDLPRSGVMFGAQMRLEW